METMRFSGRASGNPPASQTPDLARFRIPALLFILIIFFANIAEASDAIIAYKSTNGNGTDYPKLKFWNSSGSGAWGSEIELANSGSPIRIAIARVSPVSEKIVLVSLGTDNNLDAYVCASNCNLPSSWTFSGNIGAVTDSPNGILHTRRFDINFETASGDAVLVYSITSTNSSRDLAYRILPNASANFSSTSEQYLDDSGHATDLSYTWLRLARDPAGASKELLLSGFDYTDSDINAWVWDGSAWGSQIQISDSATATSDNDAEALAYAADGSKGMAAGANGTIGNINYAYWNGTTWSAVSSVDMTLLGGGQNPNADAYWTMLKADPATDDLMLYSVDSTDDLSAAYWNGSAFNVTDDISTSVLSQQNKRVADFDWNPSGSTGLLIWEESGGIKRLACSPQCTGSATTDTNYTGNGRWITVSRNPTDADAVNILGARRNNGNNIGSFRWDGSALTNYGDSAISTNSDLDAFVISFLTAKAHFTMDTTPPAVALNSPQNSSASNLSARSFNFTGSDDSSLALNCSLFLDGALNQTNSSTQNGTATIISASGLADGLHNWSVRCTDGAGNIGNSSTWFFTIDTMPPSMAIQSPANTTYNSTSVPLNYTTNGVNCWYYLNGAGPTALASCNNATLSASEGANNVSVYSNDSVGNTNSSTIFFSIDTIPPSMAIQSPTNTTYNSTSVPLNYATNGVNCWFFVDGSGPTALSGCNNSTLSSLSEGGHNVTVFANDSAGNTNSSTMIFSVDTIPPSVSILSPQNTTYSSTTVPLNYATDGQNCWFYLDASGPTALASCNNSTLSSLSQGPHNVTVFANDSVGNTNSFAVHFSVNTTLPSISLLSPANKTYNTTAIPLDYTASGTICWYYLDGSGPAALANCTNTTLLALSEGSHNISVFTNDSLNNTNSVTVYFSVDTIAPSISIQSPANSTYNSTNVPLNYTTDGQTCWFFVDGSGPTVLASCTNTTLPALSEGGAQCQHLQQRFSRQYQLLNSLLQHRHDPPKHGDSIPPEHNLQYDLNPSKLHD